MCVFFRHGPAGPGHLIQMSAFPDGPDEPGHDGRVETDVGWR